jgi:hypothetical protein
MKTYVSILAVTIAACGTSESTALDGRAMDAEPPADAALEQKDAAIVDARASDSGFVDAGVTRTITGRANYRYLAANGESEVPDDLSQSSIEALIDDGRGGWSRFPGEGRADGTFEIRRVPEGRVTVARTYPEGYVQGYVTSSSSLDLSAVYQGRSDKIYAARQTDFILSATGLAPWQATDELELFCANVDVLIFDFVPIASSGSVEVGSSSITGLTLDYGFWAGALIDGDAGDRAAVYQLTTSTAASGLTYKALTRELALAPFTMADGRAAMVSGPFVEVPRTSTISIEWRTMEFDLVAAAIHPVVEPVTSYFAVNALPRAHELGQYGSAADLMITYAASGVGTLRGDLSFGQPPSALGDRFLIADHYYGVSYLARGAQEPWTFYAVIGRRWAYDESPVIEPLLSPPRELVIDGRRADMPLTGVGQTPVIEWLPPERGAPALYSVVVNELMNDRGFTFPAYRAAIYSDRSPVRLPPGILAPGGEYVIVVDAQASPAIGPARPFATGFPTSYAQTYSAIVEP